MVKVEHSNSNKEIFQNISGMLNKYGSQGFFRHAIPKEFGGLGNSFQELCSAHFELGYKSQNTGLVLSSNAHIWGAIFPILMYGSLEQKQSLLPDLIAGNKISGHAITEPNTGSNISSISSQAVTVSSGYKLDVHKRYITNAPIADFIIVYAKLESSITAFIVDRDENNFNANNKVSGFASAPIGEIIITNSVIDKEKILGNKGIGLRMIQKVLEMERAFIFAGLVGVMQYQLEQIIAYVNAKQLDSYPMRSYKNISNKIAEVSLSIESIKLWIKRCASAKDNNESISLLSSYTKLFASEEFKRISVLCIEILGALGLEMTQPFSDFVLDSIASTILSGTSDIQKNIINGLIGSGKQGF